MSSPFSATCNTFVTGTIALWTNQFKILTLPDTQYIYVCFRQFKPRRMRRATLTDDVAAKPACGFPLPGILPLRSATDENAIRP
jgi:hypothetical protein